MADKERDVALLETLAEDEDVPAADDGARIRLQPGMIGKQLGKYTVEARLGHGAMGVVYRAKDRELGRSVAIKQLHRKSGLGRARSNGEAGAEVDRPDEALTERLVREARAMAQVSHPNVVAVYDVGVEDGITYIAMELVEGQSLRDWQTLRTVAEILEAYIAAGRGLAAAHAAGIVHRDFKPDNVLVGKDARVRVTDFGLAASRPEEMVGETTHAARSIEDINLTTSGSVLGTPAYMAPEQFLGGNIDARTDQFCFCVALHEALYGVRPFSGKTFQELSDNVGEGIVSAAPQKSEVSRQVRAILLRGMSVKPGDRYPTMGHLLEDLGRDRARPWRRASRLATTLAVILAVALGADGMFRERLLARIDQSFTLTARQTERATDLLKSRFEAISNQTYNLAFLRDVAGQYDTADFGLGETDKDASELASIHQTLASVDWTSVTKIGGKEQNAIIAIGDYKRRMLYSSASPDVWGSELTDLPGMKRAFADPEGRSLTLVSYTDPRLVATKLLGSRPPTGIAFIFIRALVVGGEPRMTLLQLVPVASFLSGVSLDETPLSVVAADGTVDGQLTHAQIDHPPEDMRLRTVDLLDLEAKPIGKLVMAAQIGSKLSLFPHARALLAAAMIGSIFLALIAARRARKITGARAA